MSDFFWTNFRKCKDLKCEKILQDVSDNIQKNVASKFKFKLEIKSEDINEIQNGYALIENDKVLL